MSVRAKFKCTSVTIREGGSRSVELWPAYGEENKSWARATPSGKIEMGIDNPEAAVQFEPGKHYFVDFTPAE